MKKKCLLLSLVLTCIYGYSQELSCKMVQVYNGKIKSLTILEPEIGKGCKYSFHEDGKTKCIEKDGMTIQFIWENDEEVRCELINNGTTVHSEYIYVYEFNDSIYSFEAGGINYTIKFRENGTISSTQQESNGKTMTSVAYYKDNNEMYPYKIISQMGSQIQTSYIEIKKTDKYGNVTEYTQTSNGTTVYFKRKIEYY